MAPKLTCKPTLLDILEDGHSDRYVQLFGGLVGGIKQPYSDIGCTDLKTGKTVHFKIEEYDITPLDGSIEEIPEEQRKNIYCSDKDVRITGALIKRTNNQD